MERCLTLSGDYVLPATCPSQAEVLDTSTPPPHAMAESKAVADKRVEGVIEAKAEEHPQAARPKAVNIQVGCGSLCQVYTKREGGREGGPLTSGPVGCVCLCVSRYVICWPSFASWLEAY